MSKAMAGISVFSFYTCFPYVVEASLSSLTVGVKTKCLRLYSLIISQISLLYFLHTPLTTHKSQLTSVFHFPLFTLHFSLSRLVSLSAWLPPGKQAGEVEESLTSHFSLLITHYSFLTFHFSQSVFLSSFLGRLRRDVSHLYDPIILSLSSLFTFH